MSAIIVVASQLLIGFLGGLLVASQAGVPLVIANPISIFYCVQTELELNL